MTTDLGLEDAADILPGDLQPSKRLEDPLNWPRGVITALHVTFHLELNPQEAERLPRDRIKARLKPGRRGRTTGRAKPSGTTVKDAEPVCDWSRKQQGSLGPDAKRQGSETVIAGAPTHSPASDGGLADRDESLVPERATNWTRTVSQSVERYFTQHEHENTPRVLSEAPNRSNRKRAYNDFEEDDRAESPSQARLGRPAPRLQSVQHRTATPRLPVRDHRRRSSAIEGLDEDPDDFKEGSRPLYHEEYSQARSLVLVMQNVNIEKDMDLMSVGGYPNYPMTPPQSNNAS